MARVKVPAGARPVYSGADGKSGALLGYSAGRRRKAVPAGLWSLACQRLVEIERLIRHRHGTGAGPVDAPVYLLPALNHLVFRERAASARTRHARPADPEAVAAACRSWARMWCWGASDEEIEEAIIQAVERPRRYKTDTIAEHLGVDRQEREALGLKTIGAVDYLKRERAADARAAKLARDAERMREKRQAERTVDREAYIATSAAELARQLGISRKTLYARMKKGGYRSVASYRNSPIIGATPPVTPLTEAVERGALSAPPSPGRIINLAASREAIGRGAVAHLDAIRTASGQVASAVAAISRQNAELGTAVADACGRRATG